MKKNDEYKKLIQSFERYAGPKKVHVDINEDLRIHFENWLSSWVGSGSAIHERSFHHIVYRMLEIKDVCFEQYLFNWFSDGSTIEKSFVAAFFLDVYLEILNSITNSIAENFPKLIEIYDFLYGTNSDFEILIGSLILLSYENFSKDKITLDQQGQLNKRLDLSFDFVSFQKKESYQSNYLLQLLKKRASRPQ